MIISNSVFQALHYSTLLAFVIFSLTLILYVFAQQFRMSELMGNFAKRRGLRKSGLADPILETKEEKWRRIHSSVKLITFISMFACLLSYPIFLFYLQAQSWPISANPMEWGVIGDFFGGILNPILAFSSFVALLYTIQIQSEELRLTKDELKRSADAHEKTEENLREQIKAGKRQAEIGYFHEVLFDINQRLDKKISEEFVVGKTPNGSIKFTYMKILRGQFSIIVTDKSYFRGREDYQQLEANNFMIVDTRFEVGTLLARMAMLLAEYTDKYGETAVL